MGEGDIDVCEVETCPQQDLNQFFSDFEQLALFRDDEDDDLLNEDNYIPRPKRIRNLLKSVPNEDGVSKNLKVKVKDAHNLPNGLRVVVNYDDKYQPIGEASGFLAGVCGQLATNCILFPISFERWSSMTDTYKDKVWESLKINGDLAKRDVKSRIGKLWREYRWKLWNEFYDPLLSRNDLIKNVPDEITMDQWALFVDYRLKPSTMVNKL
ncbi:uncharacterized protein LOC114194890 [Vigna unguiculata]|uniref:uncharacterized protein LOC114194890 n=1 Tax=Vigna unguiculata TaxID=3917 RepID=UPI0010166EA3|nr:uncharacterized protein LOC114194890 [Vigna unguiculata]